MDNYSHQAAVRDIVVKAMFDMKDADELQQYFEPHMPSVVSACLHHGSTPPTCSTPNTLHTYHTSVTQRHLIMVVGLGTRI